MSELYHFAHPSSQMPRAYMQRGEDPSVFAQSLAEDERRERETFRQNLISAWPFLDWPSHLKETETKRVRVCSYCNVTSSPSSICQAPGLCMEKRLTQETETFFKASQRAENKENVDPPGTDTTG